MEHSTSSTGTNSSVFSTCLHYAPINSSNINRGHSVLILFPYHSAYPSIKEDTIFLSAGSANLPYTPGGAYPFHFCFILYHAACSYLEACFIPYWFNRRLELAAREGRRWRCTLSGECIGLGGGISSLQGGIGGTWIGADY